MNDSMRELVAHELAVLGQPTRIRILELLGESGEMSVQVLADTLDATQQNVSRHLALLRECGLVRRRQEGRLAWYRLADDEAMLLLDEVGDHVVQRFHRQAAPASAGLHAVS